MVLLSKTGPLVGACCDWAWGEAFGYTVGSYNGLSSNEGCHAILVYYLVIWVWLTMMTYIVEEAGL